MMDNVLFTVLERYGLKPEKIEEAGGTAGKTWSIIAGGEKYFVRCRGVRTSYPERICFDHNLRYHLAKKGFPTAVPLKNSNGRTWIEHAARVYEVYPFIAGTPVTAGRIDRARIPAARTLAHFHELAADYDEPCEKQVPQYSHFPGPISQSGLLDDPAVMLEAVNYIIDNYSTRACCDELQRARDRVVWLKSVYGKAQGTLLYQVIHGDYNHANLLFAETGEVAGVFDFDWAWKNPRLRDIAELVLFFGTQRKDELDQRSIWSLTQCPQFEITSMTEVLRAYHSVSALNEQEVQLLPLAMLARWVACRTEGIMKVSEQRRIEFFLLDFQKPFEWVEQGLWDRALPYAQ